MYRYYIKIFKISELSLFLGTSPEMCFLFEFNTFVSDCAEIYFSAIVLGKSFLGKQLSFSSNHGISITLHLLSCFIGELIFKFKVQKSLASEPANQSIWTADFSNSFHIDDPKKN